MGRKIINRIGICYGRLIVIKFVGIDWNKQACWLCKCDCGNKVIVTGCHLQRGCTKSCGCLQREISSKIMSKQTGENNLTIKMEIASIQKQFLN